MLRRLWRAGQDRHPVPRQQVADGASEGRGRCPFKRTAAKVAGSIEAQITPLGKHEGGGYVNDTPRLHRCRAPTIRFAVDHIDVQILEPGAIIRATLHVHIDGEGTHRRGECLVGTEGVITATYDDTSTARNSLPNHRLRIGPWSSPCNSDNHVITNNISRITADAAGSTWVRVWIGCLAPGAGYAPRNCGA